MSEEPANANHAGHKADRDREMGKEGPVGIHRPTVDRADARVARALPQL